MENTPGTVDVHTHIYTEQAYQEYLEKAAGRVDEIVVIQYWVNNGPPRYPLEQLITFTGERDLKLIAGVNAHFDIPEQLALLERFKDHIVGVKMYPGYQPFYPHDAVVHGVAEFCQEFRKPLMLHSGALSARGAPLLKYALPIHVDELAVRYPECKIIIAHFGFPYFLETATILSKNDNVYADISGTIDHMPTVETQRRIVDHYIADLKRAAAYYPDITKKILFGTDFSGNHSHLDEVTAYFDVVNAVFEPSERLDVLGQNAFNLLF